MQCEAVKDWLRERKLAYWQVARKAGISDNAPSIILNGFDKFADTLLELGCPAEILRPEPNESCADHTEDDFWNDPENASMMPFR